MDVDGSIQFGPMVTNPPTQENAGKPFDFAYDLYAENLEILIPEGGTGDQVEVAETKHGKS